MLHLQQIHKETVHTIFTLCGVLLLLIIGVFAAAAWSLLQPKGRPNCDSFGSYGTQEEAKVAYEAALAAFSSGAYWLDGANGMVGIPCEKIYKRAYPKGKTYVE